jgi:CBS domain-containing protein
MIEELATTPVSTLARPDPLSVGPETKLGKVVEMMQEHKRGAVVIHDAEGKLAGIFTERDLMLRVDVTSAAWRDQPISSAMTDTPRTLLPRASLAKAIRLMTRGVFRHVPIVDEERRCVGMLSIRAILQYITEHYPEEFINLPPDPKRESQRRWGG